MLPALRVILIVGFAIQALVVALALSDNLPPPKV